MRLIIRWHSLQLRERPHSSGGTAGVLDMVGNDVDRQRGITILVEDPTFLGALIAFNPYEPEYTTVPVDAHGISMDAWSSA